mmetsp:Transcript_117165/g.338735  ORF Transcript_117165/g.338735 Transcript_117165/m.338735 type:complete len:208 (-) Transcript_117165:1923-2546(-)
MAHRRVLRHADHCCCFSRRPSLFLRLVHDQHGSAARRGDGLGGLLRRGAHRRPPVPPRADMGLRAPPQRTHRPDYDVAHRRRPRLRQRADLGEVVRYGRRDLENLRLHRRNGSRHRAEQGRKAEAAPGHHKVWLEQGRIGSNDPLRLARARTQAGDDCGPHRAQLVVGHDGEGACGQPAEEGPHYSPLVRPHSGEAWRHLFDLMQHL